MTNSSLIDSSDRGDVQSDVLSSAIGLQKQKRTPIGVLLAIIHPIVSQSFLDHPPLRKSVNLILNLGARIGSSTTGITVRQFKKLTSSRQSPVRLNLQPKREFDLTPDPDQQVIAQTAKEFAEEFLRPAGSIIDKYPQDLIDKSAELGITAINIPEDFQGIADSRSSVTNILVAEALAYGDMGLALLLLTPSGAASALTYWGSADQQETYLPEFSAQNPLQACVAIAEPQPLFDPENLRTVAIRTPSGYRLNGVKSLIPAATKMELFIVAAILDGQPAFFIVEASARGVTVRSDPSMGLKAAHLGQLELDDVAVPLSARLGEENAKVSDYTEAVAASRLGWAGLAIGTSQAVLDYVIPYVKERHAFGEPIAYRQSVAFNCANMAIELEGLRLIAWRGASRAEQGLPFAREAALAKILAAEKGMQIGSDGVQLLGGHGYVTEHPVELWYRDLRSIGIAEGVLVI